MELIIRYFPDISQKQLSQLEKFEALLREWNSKINIISRKDIDNLEERHILHSLAIAKFIDFKDGSTVIDLGTGGGFPGIPLAIMFPNVKFHLVDRIGKKLRVVEDVIEKCGLENVSTQHGDFTECKVMADFVVNRAVMPQKDLLKLTRKNIKAENINSIPNGLISLKGGLLDQELNGLEKRTEIIDISSFFKEPFFETKNIVYTSNQEK